MRKRKNISPKMSICSSKRQGCMWAGWRGATAAPRATSIIGENAPRQEAHESRRRAAGGSPEAAARVGLPVVKGLDNCASYCTQKCASYPLITPSCSRYASGWLGMPRRGQRNKHQFTIDAAVQVVISMQVTMSRSLKP